LLHASNKCFSPLLQNIVSTFELLIKASVGGNEKKNKMCESLRLDIPISIVLLAASGVEKNWSILIEK
jgi:hypothetical protein